MGNDIRFAFRTLRRAPGFTLIAVLSLALGIGANTAIFSLMYQVTMRSLPVHDPESLVSLRTREFGIRIALGADRSRILKLILREVGRLLAVGIGVGAPASFVLARLIESQLYGMHAIRG